MARRRSQTVNGGEDDFSPSLTANATTAGSSGGGKDFLVGSADKKRCMNLGRPGRKRGGRVGADLSPLSSAARCIE